VDIAPLASVPSPAEPTPEHNAVEIRCDHNGTPLSARGYPHTPWYLQNLAQQASTDPEGQPHGPGGNDNPEDDWRDLNGGGYDDPDHNDEPPSQMTYVHGNQRPMNSYDCPDPGNQALENSVHCRQHSTSLYYTADPNIKMANQVEWLVSSINGPYAGKHEQLAKCSFKLVDDSAGAFFFVFYNSLKSFLGSNGFNLELLPALQRILKTLDLTLTPIHTDMPCVGAYGGGKKKPVIDWIEAHNEFTSTLYALFAIQGVIAPAATCSCHVLVSYQFTGSGSQVLQDLISLHHPGHIDTQAPAFLTVKNATPIMAL
jgi:hypothetical protein